MRTTVFSIIALLLFTFGCEKGLQPVTGFSGSVTFPANDEGEVVWPDTLEGAVVAFVDAGSLNLTDMSLEDLIRNIMGFSNPLQETREQEYFLEALPGTYLAGIIGTTRPVDQLVLQPVDSLVQHPEYFFILGIYGFNPDRIPPFRFISVDDDEVLHGIHMEADYNFRFDTDIGNMF